MLKPDFSPTPSSQNERSLFCGLLRSFATVPKKADWTIKHIPWTNRQPFASALDKPCYHSGKSNNLGLG